MNKVVPLSIKINEFMWLFWSGSGNPSSFIIDSPYSLNLTPTTIESWFDEI
ncbi:MAG: hypothetical protein ABJB85_08305 [Nitrososphaerota archaeon]